MRRSIVAREPARVLLFVALAQLLTCFLARHRHGLLPWSWCVAFCTVSVLAYSFAAIRFHGTARAIPSLLPKVACLTATIQILIWDRWIR